MTLKVENAPKGKEKCSENDFEKNANAKSKLILNFQLYIVTSLGGGEFEGKCGHRISLSMHIS